MSDDETVRQDVALVTLLADDGTPTGNTRWDRLLRIHGSVEHQPISPSVWLRLDSGEPGLWPWISAHVLGNDRLVIHPIAVEMYVDDPVIGWVRHLLPRLNLNDTGDMPHDGGLRSWCPEWLWQGVPNRRWREQQFQETPLAQVQVDGRPGAAPPPLSREEERHAELLAEAL